MSRDWKVGARLGTCVVCGRSFPPGTEHHSALVQGRTGSEEDDGAGETEGGEDDDAAVLGLVRTDWCDDCWRSRDDADIFAHWTARVPVPEEKPVRMVDDGMLREMLVRMDKPEGEDQVRFRFLLALMLIRRKRLEFLRSEARDGHEIMVLRDREADRELEVVDPLLEEEELEAAVEDVGRLLRVRA